MDVNGLDFKRKNNKKREDIKMKWMKIFLSFGFLGQHIASALAQEATENAVKTELNSLAKFIIAVVTGPIAKILALLFLVAAIWKIVHKDYGSALGCVLALLALVFLPQILGVFK